MKYPDAIGRNGSGTRAKVAIKANFDTKQPAFLDFVLAHYVDVGVDELSQENWRHCFDCGIETPSQTPLLIWGGPRRSDRSSLASKSTCISQLICRANSCGRYRRTTLVTRQPFSERQGLIRVPEIQFRDSLPARLRDAIFQILRRKLPVRFLWERIQATLNPYGTIEMPRGPRIAICEDEDNPKTIESQKAFMHCEWFRVTPIR
jgi:hypothetical protein